MLTLMSYLDEACESLEDVVKLRQFILDFAFRGKLKTSNKPASIDPGTKKRTDTNNSGNAVPTHWKVRSLPECYTVLGKKHNQLQTSDYMSRGAYPIIDQGKSEIAGFSDKTEAVLRIPYPVIVFGDHTRLIKYIDFDFIIGADGVKVLKPESFIYPRYFYYFLKSLKLRDRGYARHFSVLNEYFMPFPDLSEQQEIVRIIDTFMSLFDSLESIHKQKSQTLLLAHSASIKRLIESENADVFASSWEFICNHFDVFYSTKENVEELKKAILTLAMKGKLVDQDPNDEPATKIIISTRQELSFHRSDPSLRAISDNMVTRNHDLYEIPAIWVWTTVGDISRHNSGKTLDKARNSGEMRDYITTSNLYWGRFELNQLRQMPIQDKELERCTALKGDLLICEGGEAGRAAVWEEDYGVCFQNHIHRVRLLGGIDPYFVYLYFRKLAYTGEIDKYRKGVGISNMSSKSLASIPIPLPPINEQKRIVKSVEQYLKICDGLIEKLDEAAFKQSQVLESIVRQVTAI